VVEAPSDKPCLCAVLIEYFEDIAARPLRVLLLYDFTLDEAKRLRGAVERLSQAPHGYEEQIDGFPGFVGIEGCSLVACVGEVATGLDQTDPPELGFRCVMDAAGWQHAFALLEPFVTSDADGFQYLTEAGSIEWIILFVAILVVRRPIALLIKC
jgi:hypothetical protein